MWKLKELRSAIFQYEKRLCLIIQIIVFFELAGNLVMELMRSEGHYSCLIDGAL